MGDKLEYAKAVEAWCKFYEKQLANNCNRIEKEACCIVVMSNHFGRTMDICWSVNDEVFQSNHGAQLGVDAVYKRDLLSVITHMFDQLQHLLHTRSSQNASLHNYEGFDARLVKFRSLG